VHCEKFVNEPLTI